MIKIIAISIRESMYTVFININMQINFKNTMTPCIDTS